MSKSIVFRLLLLVLLSAALINCSGDEEVKEIIRPVRYQQVHLSGGDYSRTFTGVSKAGDERNLSFRVAGRIIQIPVMLGQKVKKGQFIAAVDDSDARLSYQQALAAEYNAKVQAQTAKSNLDRNRDLYENNNVSLSVYETAKSQYASAKSNYETSKKNTTLKKRELGYYKLYAPISGVIASDPVNESEIVQAGQTIALLNSEGDIKISVGIPERFIASIKEGQKVSITLSFMPDKIFDGSVKEVSYVIDPEASTFPVEVLLLKPGKDLRPGMSANVLFNFSAGDKEQQFIVPSNTVGEDSDGNFVFTIEPLENDLATVHKKKVKIGNLTNDGIQILTGITDGDYVVTSGIDKISDGMKVKFLK